MQSPGLTNKTYAPETLIAEMIPVDPNIVSDTPLQEDHSLSHFM